MKKWIAPLLFVIAAFSVTAHAQTDINPEIANCEALRDPATITQAEFCATHPGCNLVLKVQRACSKVKSFFDNLKELATGKSKLDSNDVLDAMSPPPKDDESFRRLADPIKSSGSKARPQSKQGAFENGRRWHYEGGIEKGQLHGKGVLIADNGAMLRGEFINGQQAGLGELVTDQSHKVGVMKNGLIEGPGVERFQNGDRYEGDFKEGKAHGPGVMQYADGTFLRGSFVDGQARGHTHREWKDGTIYQGDATFYGEGLMVFNNGGANQGNMERGQLSGYGRQQMPDGTRYEGNFKNGKRDGAGKLVFSVLEKFDVEYRDGVLYNADIRTEDGRIDALIVNGVRQSARTQSASASVEPSGSSIDWGVLAQGLIGAAGAYAAARSSNSGVMSGARAAPAPLPPVQYKSYSSPAPVAPPPGSGQANSKQRVYYPMLNCIAAERTSSGGTCAKNNCGKLVTVFWQSAQTGVGAGSCYPTFNNFGSLLGACESGDSLDKSIRMCRK